MAFYKRYRRASSSSLRTFAGLVCAATATLATATRAAAQGKLDRIELFGESGASFLTLGNQPGSVQIPETSANGVVTPAYQAAIIGASRFSSGHAYLTGIGYCLSPRDLIEVTWSSSVNPFAVEPVPEGGRVESHFEREVNMSLGYARYVGRILGWRPFAVAGLGVVWTNTLPAGIGRPDPSYDFGFGADHRITDRVAVRVEARDFVERLPSPFHGYSNDIAPMAGLVISSRQGGSAPGGLSRIEFFVEGGGSFFTGALLHTQVPVCTSGAACTLENAVVRSSYSTTGIYAGGFRIYLSNRDAIQLEYSAAPNHFQRHLSTAQPPMLTIQGDEYTQSVKNFAVDYVRYLTGPHSVEPFVASGAGTAHFDGFYSEDVTDLSWNLKAGVDIPLANQLALRFEMDDSLMPQPRPNLSGLPPIHSWTNNLTPVVGLALRFR